MGDSVTCDKGRKRRRRGKRGIGGLQGNRETVSLEILQSNIRGFNSKKESLEDIIKQLGLDIVILNETSLRGNL